VKSINKESEVDLDEFEFRTQPWFDQSTFQGFSGAIPLKTMVVHCFDPRAVEIPQAVAERLGGEVYPGENILDDAGNRVGHTRTLFALSNAGGRAAAAVEAVALMDHLFDLQNVVVVHHSFCGQTAITPDQLINRVRDHHGADVSDLFDRDSLSIADFNESVRYDIALLRQSPAVPKNIKLYGFFYEINSGKLIELARDIPA
jgi:carbonic anhydrase